MSCSQDAGLSHIYPIPTVAWSQGKIVLVPSSFRAAKMHLWEVMIGERNKAE